MQDPLVLQPVKHIAGSITLPGSKSVSNRALLLAALAQGETRLTNLLKSDDVTHMINALRQLGVACQLSADGTCCNVIGNAGALTYPTGLKLFLGNAGTAMRPLAAALSLGDTTIELTGEPRMHERPIGPLVDALRQGGATIDYLQQTGFPPLALHGGFRGGKVCVDGTVSSQFLTALLMMAPLAPKATEITIVGELVSKPYIALTLHLLRLFGVEIENHQWQRFTLPGGQKLCSPGEVMVEGDASSASYFLAAAAIAGGCVRVSGVGKQSVQGDVQFACVLEKMGAKITWEENAITCCRGTLHGIDMDMNAIPDAAMTIATTALFAEGTTTIRNIYNWRVKETDRLTAMALELRKTGALVEEGHDYLRITPPPQIKQAVIETYNDHRIAMCFSLLALANAPVTLLDPGCTAKTFPDYFRQFAKICHRD